MAATEKKHTIDAAGKRLGRVAGEAAHYLMEKHLSDYRPGGQPQTAVEIENAGALDITDKKQRAKHYDRYSGHPSGRTREALRDVARRKGRREVLARAVYGMLPPNRLRAKRMRKLTINE